MKYKFLVKILYIIFFGINFYGKGQYFYAKIFSEYILIGRSSKISEIRANKISVFNLCLNLD